MDAHIPSELTRNVEALSGAEGRAWLKSLPSLLGRLETEWDISVGEPFVNGEYNFVARAKTGEGSSCVIKVAPPRNDRDHFGEAKYLKTHDGMGVVRLIRHDKDRMAMLIERAVPGRTLTSTFEGRESEAVAPAIELLRTTSRKLPHDLHDIILLDGWFDGLGRAAATAFPAGYAEKALWIYERLRTQTELIGYLHGDFHPDNIVSATRAEFLLIDPKGMLGHLGYEIAVFLNNFHWWQDDAPDIRERLDAAVRPFSEAFGITRRELREWAFAQMVLSAWWMYDEMPDLYDNDVAKADVWDV